MAPIVVAEDEWPRQPGVGKTMASALTTTKDAPAHACGPGGSYRFVSNLTCDDGTRPLQDVDAAALARSGSVGPGGRCDNVVDRYVVPCPEGEHVVFVDMYWCTDAADFDPPVR
jgi:NAD(P)H-flavin reductase